ncbi:PAS domain-containing protein [Rhodocytophaga rosea]|uniref:PAS domain-containing protein n=1 Tax=Rhodocytophaga rosea TaxID=2704465 RepID=A0A6C0GMD6_9BACT|nr:LuxR C-terminal-related transcriptional regulator [Rhodocytophaga rosea]QHT68790.1 PAS domain-containing protein [Rhodocytophaga rosea]
MNHAHQTGHMLRNMMVKYAGPQPQNKTEIETDTAEIWKGISLAEALFPAWAILLCPVHHPEMLFITRNSEAILGYPADYMMQLTPEAYFALVHPEDLSIVKHMVEYMNSFILKVEHFNPIHYRFVFHYRLKQPKGGYMHLLDEKVVIESKHKRYVFFTLFKEANKDQKLFQVKLEIYQSQGYSQVKIKDYVPHQSDVNITQREKEVIGLIRDGLSTRQISESLAISVNTVKNHRSNLFQKAKARNSRELLLYAQQAQWI